MCYLPRVIRLFAGGIRIVVFALMGVAVLATKYPWETGAVIGALAFVCLVGRGIRLKQQHARVFGLDVAAMSPLEYEQHCGAVLRNAGWRVKHVGKVGDQGIDLVAELRGVKAAIQVKRWSGKARVDSVQQAVAGKRAYGAQIAVVVAPMGFTVATQKLANANFAFLMSHADLANLERVARVH